MRFASTQVKHWAGGLSAGAALLLATFLSRPFFGAEVPASEAESTYKAKCVMCHAADGSGNTAMGKKLKLRDLRSPEVQKQSDAQITEIIAKGKSPMQAYEKQLDKDKIRALVAYVRQLGKEH